MERVQDKHKRLELVQEFKTKLRERGIKVWDPQTRPAKQQDSFKDEYLERVLLIISDRLTSLNDIIDKAIYFFKDPDVSLSSLKAEKKEMNEEKDVATALVIETFRKLLIDSDNISKDENCYNNNAENENKNRDRSDNNDNDNGYYQQIIDRLKKSFIDHDSTKLILLLRMAITGEKVSVHHFRYS